MSGFTKRHSTKRHGTKRYVAKPSVVKRYVGLAGTAIGVLAAGVAARVLTERKVVGRRRTATIEPLGSLRAKPRVVVADDSLELYAEVDELDVTAAVATPSARPPTLVFVHGHALNLDCWHFQRAELRGKVRMVFYDQRSHGRSGRSRPQQCTIDQLGRDLAAVLDELAADDPVVLVGHSMGGMTIVALADQRPEWFGSRVVGAAMISTSAGGLKAGALGLPGLPGRFAHKLSPAVVAALARAPRLVETGRRVSADLGVVVTRAYAFGGPVPGEYVDFVDEMLAATPFGVIADFYPGFDEYDKYPALAALSKIPTLLLCGGNDLVTPLSHSRRIAEQLPTAEFIELAGAGHMVLLERYGEVNAALCRLVERAGAPVE